MDFTQVLYKAQKNEQSTSTKSPVRYYSTKFEPPKKTKRENKELSDNIKKFLAKKEAEERMKNNGEKKKRDELLALRAQDKKATRRVNVMLKRTKSANQSVIDDAIDSNDTAVTLAGPSQPDEDDYGYVSQEASAYYAKMMEKYSKMPEEPKFDFAKKKVSTNLASTKDRVKAALEREREEAMMPHRRKRKRKDDGEESKDPDPTADEPEPEQRKEKPAKVKHRPMPPPLSFMDLLKVAEKKQFEPVVIEEKPKDEERPLTKKQRKELEREKEWRDRKEGKLPPLLDTSRQPSKPVEKSAPVKVPPKLTATEKSSKLYGALSKNVTSTNTNGALSKNVPNSADRERSVVNTNRPEMKKAAIPKPTTPHNNNNQQHHIANNRKIQEKERSDRKPVTNNHTIGHTGSRPSTSSSSGPASKNGANFKQSVMKNRETLEHRKEVQFKPKSLENFKTKPVPAAGTMSKQLQDPKKGKPSGLGLNHKSTGDLKPKQFPPPDVRRKEFPPRDVKRKPIINKRRILDDDDEDYDSEMDDFIDDGPEEEEDYSNVIKEIFGYDKSKYRYADEDDDNMESTFAQQMREEAISTKIGKMEDLEDLKKEEEHKRHKILMKKRGLMK